MMGLLENLIAAIVHLAIVALDLIVLFMLVRILAAHWPVWPWSALDQMAAPLIDPIVRAIQRVNSPSAGERSRTLILIAVLVVSVVLSMCRFALQLALR